MISKKRWLTFCLLICSHAHAANTSQYDGHCLLTGLLLATGSMGVAIWLYRRNQIRRQQEGLRSALAQSDQAVVVIDRQGQLLAASPASHRLPHSPQNMLQQYGLQGRWPQDGLAQACFFAPPQRLESVPPGQPSSDLAVQQFQTPPAGLPGDYRLLLFQPVASCFRTPQEASLNTILQASRIALCQFDLQAQEVQCDAGALNKLLGLDPALRQISLPDWLARVHPEDRPLLEHALQAASSTQAPSRSLEYRMQHQEQHWEWLEQTLQYQPESHILLGVSQVITSRKLAEAAMRRREQEFRTLVENSPDIIARYDLELRCQFINRSISRYSPLIRDEHIGKTIREKGWPENVVQLFENECRQLIDNWEPRCFEMEMRANQRCYIFETRLFPEFDSHGQLTSILSVDREITDSRQAKRLLTEENAVMEMIASNQPLEDTLEQICTMIETQLAGGCCSVMLLAPDGQHLNLASGKHLDEGYKALIDGIAIGPQVGSCGTAAYWKRTIIVEDMEDSPLWAPYLDIVRHYNLRACWSTPIFSSDRQLLGTFAIYYPDARTPNPDEMRLVYRSSHITAIALQRDLHEKKLFQLATKDELTGLDNRRQFMQQAERELKRSQRYQQTLAVLMMDLDHFKNINDLYGHAAGDQVIAHFAQTCREVLRESDLTGRLGGEEFAVLLPHTSIPAALAAAERLRDAIDQSQVEINGQSIHYTVSVGLSLLQDTDQQMDSLLGRADKLLYQAKHEGRNRVCHDLPLAVE